MSNSLHAVFILVIMATGAPALAQSAQSSSSQPASALAGTVFDVTGAVMQAVPVRVYAENAEEDDAPIREAVTDDNGRFSIPLPPGVYRVEVTAPAFTLFNERVTVGPNSAPLEVTLDIDLVGLEVDVSPDDAPLVADTMMSLTSVTMAGDELLDLPNDEEELANYLMMLAGADSTGDLEEDILANFVIDGFEDGRLPRPDQIAQIIVDPSSLRADGNGRPRIQIITRPGTGRWGGSVDFGFADESLNARTPGELVKEPRQTRDVEFQLEAPLVPGLLEMELQVSTGSDERAGNSLRAITPTGDLFRGVVQPQTEREVQLGARLQVTQSHRLDFQFRTDTSNASNRSVGGFTLPERASSREQNGWSFQVSERMFSSSLTNNMRLQVSSSSSSDLPVREGFAIDVADAFNGGGSTNWGSSDNLRVSFDQDLRVQRGLWNVQVGGQLQYQKRSSIDRSNYNGTYDFASLHDYCLAAGFAGVNCATTQAIVAAADAQGVTPMYLDARGVEHEITGVPVTFTQSFGNADLTFTQLSFRTHVQFDRRLGEDASLGFGVRYEGTNHSLDYTRFNPTVSLQYRLTPTTVVSGGAQLSYQDFNDRERLIRNDGSTHQSELFISSPSFPDPFASGEVEYGEDTASLWVLDPNYRSPYTFNPQVSITQQVPGNLRLSFSYDASIGKRQRRTRNINAPMPGTPLPDDILDLPRDERQEVIDQMRPMYPYVGNVTQIESFGKSDSRSIRLRVQPRGGLDLLGVNLSGSLNYSYRWAHDDNDFNNPWVPLWGLSRRDHEVQSQFRFRLPDSDDVAISQPLLRALARATYEGVNLNFNLRANTGRLYSITSGQDLNGDQSSRDRPIGVARNTETGPGSWNLDMTLTKQLRLWNTASTEGSGGQRGGGGEGARGGGRGGGGRGGSGNRGPRMQLQLRANNLLNRTQPRAYGSVVTSPLFGLPTGFTGGRTVNLSMSLDF